MSVTLQPRSVWSFMTIGWMPGVLNLTVCGPFPVAVCGVASAPKLQFQPVIAPIGNEEASSITTGMSRHTASGMVLKSAWGPRNCPVPPNSTAKPLPVWEKLFTTSAYVSPCIISSGRSHASSPESLQPASSLTSLSPARRPVGPRHGLG